jgi:hypothetical protein
VIGSAGRHPTIVDSPDAQTARELIAALAGVVGGPGAWFTRETVGGTAAEILDAA